MKALLVEPLMQVLYCVNCFRKRNAKMQKELEEACRDTRGISPEELKEGAGPPISHQSAIPTKAAIKFVSLLKR